MSKNKKNFENFESLFNRIIEKWPPRISVKDGRSTSKTGVYFTKLSDAYQKAEDSLSKNDNLGGLMVWTIFQILHKQAKELLKEKNRKIIYLKKIDISKIKRKFLKNLQVKGWGSERKLFK